VAELCLRQGRRQKGEGKSSRRFVEISGNSVHAWRVGPDERVAAGSIQGDNTAVKLRVKVVPSSSRNCIAGWLGDTLKVRVIAPPEGGRANAAVESTVAEALGLSKDAAHIVSGRASPRKVLEISGLSEADVYQRLSKGTA
jgi:uncharacterized protein (TIGR00251 family)